jgi:hypothetical protein
MAEEIALHWLDTATVCPTGVTFGVPWPAGALDKGQATVLWNASAAPLPTQTWPLAFWPDGSIKWLGVAAVIGPDDGAAFTLVKGVSPAPAHPVRVTQPGIEVIRAVDTGVTRVEVGDRGRYLIQEIVRDGRSAVGGVELALWLERRRRDGRVEVREREPFAGIIEQLTVEQAGPVRASIKLTGRYRGEQSGRLLLPYTARLVFYAGCATVELVHSFIFDGDADRDFIAALGLKAHVLLHDGVQNRHIRVIGEAGQGMWVEPVRLLPYDGHQATPDQQAQVRGDPVAPPAYGGLLPVWNDVQLLQDSCDHAVLRKRQGETFCWVNAEHCRRAPGLMSLSEPAGGLGIGLRDFWQAYPTCVEVTAAGTSEAHLNGWWWAPDAEPMDLRHYGGRDHRPIYEARNPDPTIYSSAYGIARTSQLTLYVLPANHTPEQLAARHEQVIRPPLLVAEPAHYRRCGVFGPNWAPVNRSTSARATLEDELAAYMDYYLAQQETWRWYGFWHYGDFMHTYDPQRHVWHYDQGGRAWDNTELGADIWPWYNFLRSGRADWFRFAEAMTRHVSEVDVFHTGPWTGQGSRHNVVHWGCPCKEPRASQAGAKRFYHFLTGDERCRDLLDEVAEHADQFKATNVPTEKFMARIGPTWASWAANWHCAWERTGDRRWLERIYAGLDGILTAPHRLLQGDPFDYNPQMGTMTYSQEYPFPSNRLVLTMGGAEAFMEMADTLGHARFRDALAEFGAWHGLDPVQERELFPAGVYERISVFMMNARLVAWAGARRNDTHLKRRAWALLLEGDNDPREPVRWLIPHPAAEAPRHLSSEPRQDSDLGTNMAAMISLNLIACLALAGDELEDLWRKRDGGRS